MKKVQHVATFANLDVATFANLDEATCANLDIATLAHLDVATLASTCHMYTTDSTCATHLFF